MLLYRELFLATLISAVSIAFADILVQPNSAYRYSDESNNAPHISPPVIPASYNGPHPCYEPITHKWYSVLPEQQVAAAYPLAQHTSSQVKSAYGDFPYYLPITKKWYPLPNQHVAAAQPQFTGIQTIPNYPWVDPSTPVTSSRHVSYTKIGGHGYKRPTVIIKYPKPGRRYRRSTETASTDDSSKSAIATHVDDVAAKSTLIDEKPPTLIDFLLPKNQPTDINNKHVTSRQIKSDHIEEPLIQFFSVDANTPKHSDEESVASIIRTVEQAQPVIPQEEQLDQFYQEALHQDHQENAYQEFDNNLLQEQENLEESTQVDETKSSRQVWETVINISPFLLTPTSDSFDSMSNIFKRELENAQDQFNSHLLPWLKNLLQKSLEESTQVDGTKLPKQVWETVIYISPFSLTPTSDSSDSMSNIFKRELLTNVQDQYNSHLLPRLKNLRKIPLIKVDASLSYRLPHAKQKKTQVDGTELFTHNWLDHIPKLNIKIPKFTRSWLKKLLGKDKDEYSANSDSFLVYSLDNSDNYSDDELLSPRKKYFNTICFLSNNNCITYEISDEEDNVNSIHVLQTEDD